MDLTETGLRLEIQAAEANRAEHLHKYKDNLKSYLGGAYRKSFDGQGDVVPGVYETVAVALPRYAYTQPKVSVTGRTASVNKPLEGGMTMAEQMTHAMNAWAKELSLVKRIRNAALDYHIQYACFMVRRETYKGWVPKGVGIKVMRPVAYRMNPEHVFWDPMADDEVEARYIGHGQWMSGRTLQGMVDDDPDGGWKEDVLAKLKKDADGVIRDVSFSVGTARRDDIYVRQIWVPESDVKGTEKKDFHGAIYWMGSTQASTDGTPNEAVMIRDPQPYYGPHTGPYTIVGGYPSGGGMYGLSPVVATRFLHEEVNKMASKVLQSARTYKKGTAIPLEGAELAEALESFQHTGMLGVDMENLDKIKEFSINGVDRPSLEALSVFSTLLDRQRAMDSQQMGSTQSGVTATASMVAATSAQAIGGYLQSVFEEGVRDMMDKVGWYFYTDEDAAIQIGVNVNEAEELDDIWYLPEPGDAPYSVLELEIEINSMSMSGDVQKRQSIMEAMTIIQNMAVANSQLGPVVDWQKMGQTALETLNLSQLASSLQFENAPPPEQEGGQGEGAGPAGAVGGQPQGFDQAIGNQGLGGLASGQAAASSAGVS